MTGCSPSCPSSEGWWRRAENVSFPDNPTVSLDFFFFFNYYYLSLVNPLLNRCRLCGARVIDRLGDLRVARWRQVLVVLVRAEGREEGVELHPLYFRCALRLRYLAPAENDYYHENVS